MNGFVKIVGMGCALVLGLAVMPALAQHEEHAHGMMEMKPMTASAKCPVTGEPVNLGVSMATDDGPVFFCCKGCIAKYKADTAKYAAKVAAQRKALAGRPKVQVTCPVSKEPVDQNVFIESNGKKVYFCCKGCISKYQKDPGKYASALANSYTYQTKCPVSGEDINPKAFETTTSGKNIFFCCKGCGKKLFANPEKYAPNLVAQGYTLNAKEMVHKMGGDSDQESGEHSGHMDHH